MFLKGIGYIFIFSATALLVYQLVPAIWDSVYVWRVRGVEAQRTKLKDVFLDVDPQKLFIFNFLSPVLLSALGLYFTKSLIGLFIGLALGFVIPAMLIKRMIAMRKDKFANQIVDGLMILSSCLKGGLSLLQSIESLVEELPAPINQEFGLILRENKMGIALEESFDSLNKRMASDEFNLLTTAILVARETGGDITQLFDTLVQTIRVKVKLNDNVKTLSLQGRIQGVVMSILPVAFGVMVVSFQPNYFDIMLSNPVGRALLIYAVVSEIIGVYMIKLFSKVVI